MNLEYLIDQPYEIQVRTAFVFPMKSVNFPPIPPKRYFRIGEASELCLVKDSVLRYWESEFPQIRPKKIHGHRHYKLNDLLVIRRIRELLYTKGFTISGAKMYMDAEEMKEEGEKALEEAQKIVAQPVASKGNFDSQVSSKKAAVLKSAIAELESLKAFLQN